VGVIGIAGGVMAVRAKNPSLGLLALGMAGIGAVLCLTGVGAIVGVPLIASAVTTAMAAASSTVIASSTLLSAKNRENTPFYKKPKFWLALGATLIGAALCATGIGAIVGAPLIATIIATTTLGAGGVMMTAPILTSKQASMGKKILAGLGLVVGVGLCLTGIGAIAGVPMLATLGFLGSSTASTASSAASIGTSYLTTATAVTTVAAAGGAATICAAQIALKQSGGKISKTTYDVIPKPPGTIITETFVPNAEQTGMYNTLKVSKNVSKPSPSSEISSPSSTKSRDSKKSSKKTPYTTAWDNGDYEPTPSHKGPGRSRSSSG
jgi:uncharacterized membrane protein YfcA